MKITLKANEKIYINGAVLRADRKVSIELLNDVHFLLENHVMQAEDASTPLRQLYFIVQIMLINPGGAETAMAMFRQSLPRLISVSSDREMLAGLKEIDRLVSESHIFEGLRAIRALFAAEARILNQALEPVEPPYLALVAGE